VTSLVGDIIMPIIGAIGGLDFSNYFIGLSKAVTASNLVDAKKQGAVLAWGQLPNPDDQLLDRRLCAVHGDPGDEHAEAQGRSRPGGSAEAEPRRELLTEIRDLLKKA